MGKITIKNFISRNLVRYPLTKEIDIYKEIYQASYLSGHFVSLDALDYLRKELDEAFNLSLNKPLYEFIDIDVVRVNLECFSFDVIELFEIFKKSSECKLNKDYYKYLEEYGLTKFYQTVPSHSELYRSTYHPHYRVCYFDYIPTYYRVYKLSKFIEEKRKNRNNNDIIFIALDGLPYSGKSTISSKLLDVSVFHIDEVDIYYLDKLLASLKINKKIEIDCSYRNASYKRIIEIKDVVIVEGRYSYINFLRKYYNYLAFTIASPEMIERRNKDKEIIDFDTKKYYEEFDFIKEADILI